jgi:hypothetical protein
VSIGPLHAQAAIELFRVVVERLAARKVTEVSDEAILQWLDQEPTLHLLPLYTIAAAIHAVLAPGERLQLNGARIVEALVDRERRRLDGAGQNAGWGEYAASRRAGLATLRGGLDATAIRRLASPRLEIGLPEPAKVVDAVKRLGWWRDDQFPAPVPDMVAAELLRQVLDDRPDLAPKWVWEVVSGGD